MRAGLAAVLVTALACPANADPLQPLTRAEATSPAPLAQISHTASCPAGTRLTGIGGVINQSTGKEALTALEPDSGLTKGTVSATGPAGNWTVTANVVCSEVAGLKLVRQPGPVGFPVVTADCGPGHQVLGAGGRVPGAQGNKLLAIEPNDALTSVTVIGQLGAGRWAVTAYAICVPTA
ncbi:hypothetical protein ALI144C_19040 [Actinosynnema sp. ALI-1.44]|nr:hypothetical protein ALI144C_19040 [Actinosynnema sp. ALI-1.44]